MNFSTPPSSPLQFSLSPAALATTAAAGSAANSSLSDVDETVLFGVTASLFAALAVAVSMFLIVKHLLNFSLPNHQRYIIRILLMVPVYAICSVVSIFLYKYHSYIALIRDCYEAFVLYSFFSLCINYGGGFDNLALRIAAQPPLRLAFPFNCFPLVQPGKEFLNWNRRGLLQYVFVRPICAVIAVVLQTQHRYEDGVIDFKNNASFLYISFVVNVSMTVALYCLVFFYQASQEELAPYRPLLKFVCIKFVLFFSYWQWIAVVLLVDLGAVPAVGKYSEGELASVIQNTLICIEMLLAACLHIKSFPADAYAMQTATKAPLIHETTEMGSWLKSVSDSANPRDVLADTVDSFVPEMLRKRPSRHQHGTSAMFDEQPDDANAAASSSSSCSVASQTTASSASSSPPSPAPAPARKPLATPAAPDGSFSIE